MTFEFQTATVLELVRDGLLWVEDGNHGENRPLAHEFNETGTPFIRPDDLSGGSVRFDECDRINEEALQRVRKGKGRAGDIAFTHRATVGRIARVCDDAPNFVANPGVTIWRSLDSELLDRNYLYYFMQTPFFMDQVWAEAGNTDTFPYISLTQQRRLLVRFPAIALQRATGKLLGDLDDRITLLRETNATLEAIAQALFRSWFVDFDPVRAKAEGREPGGMDEATAGLFPAGFEESTLGEVPKGWNVGTLANLMRLHRGSINPGAQPDAEFLHFSLPAFDGGQMPVRELGQAIKSNKTTVPEDAVLVSKLNPHIPRVWLPSTVGQNAVCSTEFLPFVPTELSTTAFAYSLLAAAGFSKALCQLVTGTSNSHQRIKPDGVLSMPCVIPPVGVVAVFDFVVNGLLARLKSNRLQAQTLVALRDTLLPRLISGQLRVPEADDLLNDALS